MNTEDYRPTVAPPKTIATPSAGKTPVAKPPAVKAPDAKQPVAAYPAAVLEKRPGGCDLVSAPPPPQLLDGVPVKEVAGPPPSGGTAGSGAVPGVATAANAPFGAVTAVCVALGALLAMWMFSAMSPFLANALSLHGWRCAISLVLGLLPVAVAAAIAWRVWTVFKDLPDFPQEMDIGSADAAELRERLLSGYLARLPAPSEYAADNGFRDCDKTKAATLVADNLRRLRGEAPDCYADSSGWLADFRAFQALQDARGREIARSAAKLVGIKTAASPWKIVDMLCVMYHSSIMVTRLARLYNRQVSPRQALRLVCQWMVGIYVSGEIGAAAQDVVEWGVASDWISAALKPVASIAGKAVEGGANALLAYRLGLRAIDAFRPLKVA